jgi:hypothetical protein
LWLTGSGSYYVINLQQRFVRRDRHTPKDADAVRNILDAANKILSLVEDSLLHWTPEHFPMIYVGAIFSAMTTHVANCGVVKRDQLVQKLRPNLIALKQFEQCYITARWIRMMFMDLVKDPQQGRDHGREESAQPHSTSDDSEILSFRNEGDGPASVPANDDFHLMGHTFSQGLFERPSSSYDSGRCDASPAAGAQSHLHMNSYASNSLANDFLPFMTGLNESDGVDFSSVSAMDSQSLHFLANVGLSDFASWPEQTH